MFINRNPTASTTRYPRQLRDSGIRRRVDYLVRPFNLHRVDVDVVVGKTGI